MRFAALEGPGGGRHCVCPANRGWGLLCNGRFTSPSVVCLRLQRFMPTALIASVGANSIVDRDRPRPGGWSPRWGIPDDH